MMMRMLSLALIAGLMGLGVLPQAQETKGESAKAEPPAQESSADQSGGGALGADMGFDFDKLAAETIEYTPDGGLHMIGNVVFKSSQLSLESRDLTLNKETKVLVATGGPVKITQGNVNAECRNFNYNIDKKQSRLTGNPFIIQKNKDGSTTRIKGDVIVISQSANGQASVSVQSKSGQSEIVKGEGDKKQPEKKGRSTTPAKKVTPDNQDLIKVPAID